MVCFADDSYLVFKGDSWDEVCKIASTENTCVMDWLQDVGMGINNLKTEVMYFSKHDQVGLKIQVSSSKNQIGKTIGVLEVKFNCKLSWKSHIAHIPTSS
jgi:hypothetical protein